MSSDGFSNPDLTPDYRMSWKILMRNLVKFLVSSEAEITTWNDKEVALFRGRGCVLGQVVDVNEDSGPTDQQTVSVKLKYGNGSMDYEIVTWDLPKFAKRIRKGDLLCQLSGASRLSVLRFHNHHFSIVSIALKPHETFSPKVEPLTWSDTRPYVPGTKNIPLVWDWHADDAPVDITDETATLTHDVIKDLE